MAHSKSKQPFKTDRQPLNIIETHVDFQYFIAFIDYVIKNALFKN